MQKLKSSFIKGAKYDPQSKHLTIYIGKKAYEFKPIPLRKYQALLKAKSKGRYFNKYLKTR